MISCTHCGYEVGINQPSVTILPSRGGVKFNKTTNMLAFHEECFEAAAGEEYLRALQPQTLKKKIAVAKRKMTKKKATKKKVKKSRPILNGQKRCAKTGCSKIHSSQGPYCSLHDCQKPRCRRIRYSPGIPYCIRCKP